MSRSAAAANLSLQRQSKSMRKMKETKKKKEEEEEASAMEQQQPRPQPQQYNSTPLNNIWTCEKKNAYVKEEKKKKILPNHAEDEIYTYLLSTIFEKKGKDIWRMRDKVTEEEEEEEDVVQNAKLFFPPLCGVFVFPSRLILFALLCCYLRMPQIVVNALCQLSE